jgi:hypothetical protein
MNSVIRQLRDLVPLRPLTTLEAMRTAELQAGRTLRLVDVTEPPVPESAISELPRLQVERMTPAPVSGAAQWTRGRWLILVNGAESEGRQRFSLAHEFKHVIDSPFAKLIYPPKDGVPSYERAEYICDYFAACLLMPRTWVKQHYCVEGIQELRRLAKRFDVSQTAMQIRLNQIGLTDATRRCLVGAP